MLLSVATGGLVLLEMKLDCSFYLPTCKLKYYKIIIIIISIFFRKG